MPLKLEWYTTKEVADALGIHRTTAIRLGRQENGIPGLFRVGNAWRWRREEVDGYVAELKKAERRRAARAQRAGRASRAN